MKNSNLIDNNLQDELEDFKLIQALDNFYFDKNKIEQIMLYLNYPLSDGLYIFGQSGLGKTSYIYHIAQSLNWPIEQLTVCAKTDIYDLVGRMNLQNGSLVFEKGPLVKALEEGKILVINEIDLIKPEDLCLLNEVLEDHVLHIDFNNNMQIKAHKNFRIIATANTVGNGDNENLYYGVNTLNQAFMDRWRFIHFQRPNDKELEGILKSSLHTKDTKYLNKLIKFYNLINKVKDPQSDKSSLDIPFSIRNLIKMGKLYKLGQYPMVEIVSMVYALRLPQGQRDFVLQVCIDVFGSS